MDTATGRSASRPAGVRSRPKLLYLVTEDWYFVSHRLPMARAALAAGYEVVVAARMREHRTAIEAEGMRTVDPGLVRGSINPFREVGALRRIVALYRREKPDLVHHVALKPTLLGALAARFAGVPLMVNAVAGLGYLFGSTRLVPRLVRRPLLALLRILVDRPGSVLLVQNADDAALFAARGIAHERIVLIRGSGVDVARFTEIGPPPADGPVTAAFVGRMLEYKGAGVLVEAHRLLRARGIQLRTLLCGSPDPENPGSIAAATLEAWAREPGVEWLGHVADVSSVWRQAHIAVLPSRSEGLPLSLLEAAAAGRPLVACDVAGSREVAHDGENAILVPTDDAQALADALARLAGDASLRARLGAASRRIVATDMTSEAVGAQTIALYDRMIASPHEARRC